MPAFATDHESQGFLGFQTSLSAKATKLLLALGLQPGSVRQSGVQRKFVMKRFSQTWSLYRNQPLV